MSKMPWRYRLARWILTDMTFVIVPTEYVVDYLSILQAEAELKHLLARHPHLAPVAGLLDPRTNKRDTKH